MPSQQQLLIEKLKIEEEAEARLKEAVLLHANQDERPLTKLAADLNVDYDTLYRRVHGSESRKISHNKQRNLTFEEELILENWIKNEYIHGRAASKVRIEQLAVMMMQSRDCYKKLGTKWFYRFRKRHPDIHLKRLKSMPKGRMEGSKYEKLEAWFEKFENTVKSLNILPENIYNMDETAVQVLEQSNDYMAISISAGYRQQEGSTRSELSTSIETISATGKFLQPLFIMKGENFMTTWFDVKGNNIPEFSWGLTVNGWSSTTKACWWLNNIFLEQTKPADPDQWRLLVLDGHASHTSNDFVCLAKKHKVYPLYIPAHSSHLTQPLDLVVFAKVKKYFKKDVVEKIRTSRRLSLEKKEIILSYDDARKRSFTEHSILSAWRRAGLVPYNPSKVLDRPEVIRSPEQEVDTTTEDVSIPMEEDPFIDQIEPAFVDPKRPDAFELNAAAFSNRKSDLFGLHLIRCYQAECNKLQAELVVAQREIEALKAWKEKAETKTKGRRVAASPNSKALNSETMRNKLHEAGATPNGSPIRRKRRRANKTPEGSPRRPSQRSLNSANLSHP
ncbi:uncharacterized protein J8A68_000195 [[Candida] subhashii]|uniref:HTH CENPB-type domain-containing protein n=1 Tax=[Candida] subhashii TaxID=561895 RepID=A0A8J5QUE7_9ASCO|nr:uncharacterized protein J8A68_000195 [[Candida] subhashii]KAG7666264.1 hypothetical protein J8A68_000195 [[Candida] subhashii]